MKVRSIGKGDVKKEIVRRWLLLGLFCAVGVVAVFETGHLSHVRAHDALEHSTLEGMTAVRQAKLREIQDYFEELRAHVRLYASSKLVADALVDFSAAFEGLQPEPNDAASVREHDITDLGPDMHAQAGEVDIEALIPTDEKAIAAQAIFLVNAYGEHHVDVEPEYHANALEYGAAHKKHHHSFVRILEAYGLYDLILAEPEGRVVYDVDKEPDFGTSLITGPYRNTNLARVYEMAIASAPGEVVIVDFERFAPSHGAPAAFIASPVYRDGDLLGVFAIEISADHINSVMTGDGTWHDAGLGDTGETYLVGPDMLMRSDSRFLLEYPERFQEELERLGVDEDLMDAMLAYHTTILFERVEMETVTDALAGEHGTRILDDYRGESVLCSYAPADIEGLNWAILAEIEAHEAFAPSAALRVRLLILTTFISALFIGAGLGLALLMSRNERVIFEKNRITNDLAIASGIQKGLLPSVTPQVQGFDIAGWSRPADETGGDYFDWQPLVDGRVAISLADVTGHGIGPALVTAVCRAYARASFLNDSALGALMDRINSLLVEDLPEGRFITFVVGVLDPAQHSIELLSAGHGPLLVYRAATKSVESMDAHDLPFGIVDGITYGPPDHIAFEPGDMLILVTDGFFEWPNERGEMYGLERLTASILASAHRSSDEMIEGLLADLEGFVGASAQPDDLTAVVIRRSE